MRRETAKYNTQFFAIFWTPEVIWQLFAIICDYIYTVICVIEERFYNAMRLSYPKPRASRRNRAKFSGFFFVPKIIHDACMEKLYKLPF